MQAKAQTSWDCSPDKPFNLSGEKVSYELVYNWGLIWASAGKVDFSVRDTLVNGETCYKLKGYGTSYESWDWFYKVRSTYESLTNSQLKPIWFRRKGKEGSHHYNTFYSVKENEAEMVSIDRKGKVSKTTFALAPCSFDVISAVYYCRHIDFSQLKPQETIPLSLFVDGASHPSYLRYLGKEKWTDERDGKSYNCIKFSPLLIEGTVFKEGENMVVYVTDDHRKLPVYIETELVVGKAKVFLLKD
jgi:hypothetical protein